MQARLADQAPEVSIVLTERQANVQHLVGGDRRAFHRLIPNARRHCGLDLRGQRNRDQAGFLAVHAGHPDQGFIVCFRHHFEATVGKALAAVRALKSAGLAAKDIENVHGRVLPAEPSL